MKFSTDSSYNSNSLDNKEEEIDLREIVFKYLRHWKWFILSVVLLLIIGVFIYLRTDREYGVSTSVLLKENNGTGGGAQKGSMLGSLEELGLLSTTNNIDNEIAVLSSPNLMVQIVQKLELQTSYFENGLFRDNEVYRDCPYYVRLEDVKPDDIKGALSFSLKKEGAKILLEGKYLVNKEEIAIEGSLSELPGFVNLPSDLGRLYIAKRPEISGEQEKKEYLISIRNAQGVAYKLAKEIKVTPTTKSSSVLNISLNVLNVEKGIDILNEIVKTYNANNIKDNNEMALNTATFINERLDSISIELSDIEDKVVDYKKEQGIADLSTEAKVFVEQTSVIEQRRIDIQTQLKTIEWIENFVQKSSGNDYKLIPNLGITDPGLAAIISQYNESLLAYQRLERTTSETSPSRQAALSELSGTRGSIKDAVNAVRKGLDIAKVDADRQASRMSSRIRTVPTQERGLLEVTRQQQIKQALYLYLMQMREETSITMASTADKAKVITDPIVPDFPISPNRNIILLASLLIGVIIPIVIIYIRDLLQLNITSREELEKLSDVTVIGEIMRKEEDGVIVVDKNKTTPIVELFRTLRNNVQFILDEPDKKIILVTSTVPGEGKTFVSVNVAVSFALSDKKILLIGMDIRNPKLAVDMNFPKGAGLTSYLSGSEPDWTQLLTNLKEYPNLDILQAGAIPPNPNELLMKPALKQLLNEARDLYDVIIIDSAPIGVVSDTFLLTSQADTTIYVTRENVTPKNAVTFVNEVYHDKKLPNMYLVINGVEPSKNKGRYGRYGYGYTYGYGESK